MEYRTVHEDLLREFPELVPAYQQLLQEERTEQPGQYIIFEDVFARYIQELLTAAPCAIRDEKLRAVFRFIDRMLGDGGEVQNLGYVGMLEWQSDAWLQAAKPFFGVKAEAALDRYEPEWRIRSDKRSDGNIGERDDRFGINAIVRQVLSGTL